MVEICFDEGMEAMSTYILVLLLRKELVPNIISELVQSRNGLTSHSSASFGSSIWDWLRNTLTHLLNQLLPGSKVTLTEAIYSLILLRASSLYLFSSSI